MEKTAPKPAIYHPPVWILLTALAVRLAFFLVFEPWSPEVEAEQVLTGDAPGYHEYAVKMLEGGLAEVGDLSVRRTPGYPFFLAAVYFVAGAKPWVVLLVQYALGLGILSLTYHLARDWFGAKAGTAAAFLYAIEPHSVLFATRLLTDTLFGLLFLAAVASLAAGIKSNRWTTFAFAGLLLGFATLVRPVAQFLPVVFLIPIVVFKRRPIPAIFSQGILLIVAFAVVVTPWLVRNYSEYGKAGLTDKGGQHLLLWVATYVEKAHSDRGVDEIRRDFMDQAREAGYDEAPTPFDKADIQARLARDYLANHPKEFLFASLRGILFSFLNLGTRMISEYLGMKGSDTGFDINAPPSVGESMSRFIHHKQPGEILVGVVVAAFMFASYGLALAGLVLAIKARNWFPVFVLLLMSAYFMMLIGPIGIGRYKLPFVPLYLAFAGFGAMWLMSLINNAWGQLRTRPWGASSG